MRAILGVALAAAMACGAAQAQDALKPGTPSILVWSPQQQSDWYRSIETVYKVGTVKRGAKVHPLPMAPKPIEPTFTFQGKTWTVDDYMKAYQDAITRCNTPHAPWYIVPTDRKWYRLLVVSEILRATLERMNPQFPPAKVDRAEALRRLEEIA